MGTMQYYLKGSALSHHPPSPMDCFFHLFLRGTKEESCISSACLLSSQEPQGTESLESPHPQQPCWGAGVCAHQPPCFPAALATGCRISPGVSIPLNSFLSKLSLSSSILPIFTFLFSPCSLPLSSKPPSNLFPHFHRRYQDIMRQPFTLGTLV